MIATFAFASALFGLAAAPAAAGMTETGYCLHEIRADCATTHVDAKGRMTCTQTGKALKMKDECGPHRVTEEDLRADDIEPEGLDAYSRWRFATEAVADDALASMNADMLRVFRNTFFAGHGRVFADKALDRFFRGFSWYKPRAGFREADLSAVEKSNVARAAALEAELRKDQKAAGRRLPARGWFIQLTALQIGGDQPSTRAARPVPEPFR